MMDKRKVVRRSLNVDYIKVLACYFVIALHMSLMGSATIDHSDGTSRLLNDVFTLGVPMFFIASGFFFFRNPNFLQQFLKIFLKILLPTIVVAILSGILWPWTIGKCSLWYAITHPFTEDLLDVLKSFLNWTDRSMPTSVAHLWYVKDYVKCLILYPLCFYICNHERWATVVRTILIWGFLAFYFVVDLHVLPKEFMIEPAYRIKLFTMPIILMLIGYNLYERRSRLRVHAKSSMLIGIAVFLGGTAARYMLSLPNMYFEGWENLFAILSAMGVVLFFLAYPFRRRHSKRYKMINRIGERTFFMYLIHLIVVQKIRSRGLEEACAKFFHAENPLGTLIVSILMPLVVFGICLLIATGLHELNKYLSRLIRRWKKNETVQHTDKESGRV